MDYLELAAKGCIWLGGSMLIAVALYLARAWWLERKERRRLEVVRQKDDAYYASLHESLLQHIEALLRKVDRQ
jgi:hypothetical protein